MKDILSLIDAEGEDIVEVIKEDSGEVITSGKWFEDNILQYSQTDSSAKEGYRFRLCEGYSELEERYKNAINKIGRKNLLMLPDKTKEILKHTTNL